MVLSKELCVGLSCQTCCFLSPAVSKNSVWAGLEVSIGSHPGRDLLKGILKLGGA